MPSLQQQKRHREEIQILLRAAEICEKEGVSRGSHACILQRVDRAERELSEGGYDQTYNTWAATGHRIFGYDYQHIYRKNDRIDPTNRKRWAVEFLREYAEKLRKGGPSGGRSPAT